MSSESYEEKQAEEDMLSEPDKFDQDEAESSNVKKVNVNLKMRDFALDDSPGVKTRTNL